MLFSITPLIIADFTCFSRLSARACVRKRCRRTSAVDFSRAYLIEKSWQKGATIGLSRARASTRSMGYSSRSARIVYANDRENADLWEVRSIVIRRCARAHVDGLLASRSRSDKQLLTFGSEVYWHRLWLYLQRVLKIEVRTGNSICISTSDVIRMKIFFIDVIS